jgi:hypothetical protein
MFQNPNVNINWVPGITLEEMEKHCILAAYKFCRENKTQTAGMLGIAIRTLDNKLEKYEADYNAQAGKEAEEAIRQKEIGDRLRGVAFTTANSVGHIYQPTAQNEASKALSQAAPRLDIQSPAKASAQHEMSVSQRAEVQAVLPGQAGPVGNRKAGRRV